MQLARSKLSSITELISKALNDGRVSHEEFSFINAELVRFRQLKNEIRKAPQEAQPTLETANVEERVRKEILNSLAKKTRIEVSYKKNHEGFYFSISKNVIRALESKN